MNTKLFAALGIFWLTQMVVCNSVTVQEQRKPEKHAGVGQRKRFEPDAMLPRPDKQDVKYGRRQRNVLDLWMADSTKPTPVLIHIHGGGFAHGDKSQVDPLLLKRSLERGLSVASINYRFVRQAPLPAAMYDAARAVQFLRYKAKEWNLDPSRLAATGASAGGGVSLWLAFQDDLADPGSGDPVARQSSRLSCVAVWNAQTTYDPREVAKIFGTGSRQLRPLNRIFQLMPGEADTPRAYKMYEEASPMAHLTADDPPVFLYYATNREKAHQRKGKGGRKRAGKQGGIMHDPRFGDALKKRMDELKIRCVMRRAEHYRVNPDEEANVETVDFIASYLFGSQ